LEKEHITKQKMTEINKIIQGDCRTEMKKLSGDSVDICICSPPYLAGTDISTGKKSKYEGYDDSGSVEDYYKLIKESLTEAIRVTKYYVFWNFQILSKTKKVWQRILWEFRDNIKEYFIWAKSHSQPAICEGVVSSGFEFIICFTKPEYATKRRFERYFFSNRTKGAPVVSNTIIAPPNFNTNAQHLAQFPAWLPRYFIKNFSKEGDIILDCFAGLSTTLKVAKQMGRNYLGFELIEKYVEMGNKGLEQEGLGKWV